MTIHQIAFRPQEGQEKFASIYAKVLAKSQLTE